MKVYIQSVNFNADKDLVEFVEKKVSALEKFYDKVVDSEVFLKVQHTSEKENKIVEVKIKVPGDEFIVKKVCRSFEKGVVLATDSLKRQLNRRKEKQRAHHV